MTLAWLLASLTGLSASRSSSISSIMRRSSPGWPQRLQWMQPSNISPMVVDFGGRWQCGAKVRKVTLRLNKKPGRSRSMRQSGFRCNRWQEEAFGTPELLEQSQSLCFAVDSRSAEDYSLELLRTLRRCGTIRVGRGEGAHRFELRLALGGLRSSCPFHPASLLDGLRHIGSQLC